MIRPSAARGDVLPYDFRRPSRIPPERQRSLTASHEQLAQALQRWISTRLRASFEVRLESVAQEPYGGFVTSVADPGATFLYDIKNMPGRMMAVYLDPRIAFLLIEKVLGGNGVSPVPDRALTQLESVVMRLVTDRVAKEVAEVWKDHMHLEFEFARFEAARDLIEMTGREDDILLTTLQVAMGEIQGVIQFALPFSVLESFVSPPRVVRPPAEVRPAAERAGEQQKIEHAIRRARVVVSARLPRFRATLGRLTSLQPGDVVTVETSVEEPIEILVGDAPRFRAKLGKVGNHLGVQITRPTDAT